MRLHGFPAAARELAAGDHRIVAASRAASAGEPSDRAAGDVRDDDDGGGGVDRFRRLFALPVWWGSNDDEEAAVALREIAEARVGVTDRAPRDGLASMPSGYTYLGQLLVHDLSFGGLLSAGLAADRLEAWTNLRTPRLDLDCLYGIEPNVDVQLFERAAEPGETRCLFRLGQPSATGRPQPPNTCPLDLARVPDVAASGKPVDPLLADPRNDDHLLLSQLVLLLVRMHNRIVGALRPRLSSNREAFEAARGFVVAAYRNIVVYDYLSRLLPEPFFADLLRDEPALIDAPVRHESAASAGAADLPIEFPLGAARIGHAMTRDSYRLNGHVADDVGSLRAILAASSFASPPGVPVPDAWALDWGAFFELDGRASDDVQRARRITPFYSYTLVHETFPSRLEGKPDTLSFLDLWRCRGMVPSGQACARWLGERLKGRCAVPELEGAGMSPEAFEHPHRWGGGKLAAALERHGWFLEDTPLSYYLQQEAAVLGSRGVQLGPLGAYVFASACRRGLTGGDRGGALPVFPYLPIGQVPGVQRMAELVALLGGDDAAIRRKVHETLEPCGFRLNQAPSSPSA
jgi:hypothetical protein